ncbi:hypothetical protein QWY86_12575 [Pedobacter aquatilis]|uniref:hypothetical protein n=1 Tax=Pedobacter aquatilis TaxID=351343 RepID=UPI0025B4B481|nr:hypothetical protein [Pedobacter aquatilis]MDN3587511.1 hypothetical protein [Pedobacter aquatilis]
MKKIILLNLLLHCCLLSWSQGELNQFRKIKPTAFLFLHHDKGIYTNNEKIWFSAYLLNTPNSVSEHEVLNVALINELTKKVDLSQKFNISNGLSSGFVWLPDSIPPGNYQILAYTNVLNAQELPVAQFTSSVKVLNISQPTFTSKLTLLDSVVKNGGIRTVIDVSGLDANRKATIVVNYQVGEHFSKSIKLDKKQVTITIPEDLLKNRATLLLNVNVDGEVQYHSKALPEIEKQKIDVKFYPEGGEMVAGLQSRVGWEAKTTDGRPLALKGMLMKNNEAQNEIFTNAYGMGSFTIHPQAGESYSVNLYTGTYVSENSNVKLPSVSNATDITISLPKALVNDSLRFILSSKMAKPIQIVLHNDLGDYVLLNGKSNESARIFNISLLALPKGITTLTILDDAGKPLAERLFFAHYNQQELYSKIEIEKSNYAKRDSIRIKLKLADNGGKAASGIVSVAVVQRNRISIKTANIEDYFYLHNNLKNLPANPSANNMLDKNYLEDVLLIKGWRRYTREELIAYNQDSIFKSHYPLMMGAITSGKKTLKKAVDLVSFGGINTGIITTNTDGSFELSNDNLLVEQNKNIYYRLGLEKNGYDIKVNDAFIPITNILAKNLKRSIFESLSNNQENSILKNLQNVISLKDVEITVKQSGMYGTKGEPGANECGDYVNGQHPLAWLNYEGTPLSDRQKPIKNRPYLKHIQLDGAWFRVERVYYTGCLTENEKKGIAIKGINSGKEYYMAIEDDGGLQYHSTLYWQSGLVTDASGEIPINFKAGDIADDFSIIVQGISNKGLVNMKETFKIIDKP